MIFDIPYMTSQFSNDANIVKYVEFFKYDILKTRDKKLIHLILEEKESNADLEA